MIIKEGRTENYSIDLDLDLDRVIVIMLWNYFFDSTSTDTEMTTISKNESDTTRTIINIIKNYYLITPNYSIPFKGEEERGNTNASCEWIMFT